VADAHLIDWDSAESHLILNPRMPAAEREMLATWVGKLPRHIWLTTSGTSGTLKLVALSKDAILASAAAVNRRLESDAHDVWYSVLPRWHVGGLGIEARAHLSGATVIRARWDPRVFATDDRMTLSALVPAQVSDLVEARLGAPEQLRAIVVGGGAMRGGLYEAARALGWPVLPSYGMTETCSQVATAKTGDPAMQLLDHVEARVEMDGRLAFRGPSLLTAYVTGGGIVDPKTDDGWFTTEDLGEVEGDVLRVSGRRGSWVKIGGESVDLSRLDAILEGVAGAGAAVVAVPDARLGHVIWLVVETGRDGERIRDAFSELVFPFERPRGVVSVPAIPRSDLGKLLRARLVEEISKGLE
jgi:O-succinylbenzoic acid--CoA ligase